jgi:hypothetical protein
MNVIDKKATELAYDMIEEGHPREKILEELTNYYEFHDQLKIELKKLKIPKDERKKWYIKIERTVKALLIESQSLPQSEDVPSAINGRSFLKFWGQYAQHYLSASRIDVCLKRLPTLYDLVLYGKYQRLTIRGVHPIDSRYILWLHVDNRNLTKRRPFQLTHNTALDKSKGMDLLDNLVKTGRLDDVLFSTEEISLDIEGSKLKKGFVNNFNPIHNFDDLKQHFISLTTTKSKLNNKPFLTEEQLNEFLFAAFQYKQIEKKIEIPIKRGDIKVIRTIFYKFFSWCERNIEDYKPIRSEYVKLLSDYFLGFDENTVANNFNK